MKVLLSFYGILALWKEKGKRKGWCIFEHLFLPSYKIEAFCLPHLNVSKHTAYLKNAIPPSLGGKAKHLLQDFLNHIP